MFYNDVSSWLRAPFVARKIDIRMNVRARLCSLFLPKFAANGWSSTEEINETQHDPRRKNDFQEQKSLYPGEGRPMLCGRDEAVAVGARPSGILQMQDAAIFRRVGVFAGSKEQHDQRNQREQCQGKFFGPSHSASQGLPAVSNILRPEAPQKHLLAPRRKESPRRRDAAQPSA
jgi:hypothetical protein